ncbi:MAG: hypothetical protein KME45_12905 [Stenomitos rutilans HA7619-LM2]|nr:hypothetical protein [Stenomitos rutilans HA7619-LM2]
MLLISSKGAHSDRERVRTIAPTNFSCRLFAVIRHATIGMGDANQTKRLNQRST